VTTETALTISDAAAAASVSAHTLRYYERAGLMPPIGRAASSHRMYSARDVEWVIFLTRLRATGMPIRRMREYADLLRAGPDTDEARLALLEEHRDSVRRRLSEIEANLALIEIKINFQRQRMKARNGATPH
jgi:DNA-binding transcriptional MerR regulator